jgi:hypothetical protein
MKTIPPSLFQYLGTNTNGDLGPYTFYTSHRKRLVVFPKTWPKDPATYHQTLYRNRWRHAAIRWHSLTPQTRADWRRLGKKANLTISGYNLYLAYILGKAAGTVRTCERLTGVNVIANTGPPLPYRQA